MLNSFNFAIEHGVFHRDQKTSLISLLLKKGKDPLDCSSYRPISLIPCRDASIRYSGSVSAPIRSFSVDRVSERRDRSKSDIVCILFCVIVKPHESTKAL